MRKERLSPLFSEFHEHGQEATSPLTLTLYDGSVLHDTSVQHDIDPLELTRELDKTRSTLEQSQSLVQPADV